MTETLLTLALIGATLIVTRSTIFRPLQKLWPLFFRCPQCIGFWVGVAAGGFQRRLSGNGKPLDAFVVGCATSLLSMFTNALLIVIDVIVEKLDTEEVEPEPVEEPKGPLA